MAKTSIQEHIQKTQDTHTDTMSKDSEHEKNQQTTDMDEKNKTPCEISVLSTAFRNQVKAKPTKLSSKQG